MKVPGGELASTKRVYLAGGFYGGWKDVPKVLLGAAGFVVGDPEAAADPSAKLPGFFVGRDLASVEMADVVLAYQDDYPLVYGMAAEVGYAAGRGTPVVYVCTAKRVDVFLAGLSKAIFTDVTAACEFIKERFA